MSPEIAIEFLFLQYQDKLNKLTKNFNCGNKDIEREKLEFELKLYFEGFKYIGGGISRKVFLHEKSKRCFKIQYGRHANAAMTPNELEMKSFLSVSKNDRQYFAKPYGFIHGETDLMEVEYVDWPIANKAKVNYTKLEKALEQVNKLSEKYGLCDVHGGNYAINEETGDIKFLDYAW